MSVLQTLRQWLDQHYQEQLGIILSDGPDKQRQGASWYEANKGGRAGAWLLDYDIGLMLRVMTFQQDGDVFADINVDIQEALESATSLQPRYGIVEDKADQYGLWQVGMLWLVQVNQQDEWRDAIANLRAESGFSEEIALDVVFYRDEQSFEVALNDHTLPSLLLRTRNLFRMKADELPTWLTANEAVRDMLQNFPSRFSRPEVRVLAEKLVNDVRQSLSTQDAKKLPLKPKTIGSLEVWNCRNLPYCRLNFSRAGNKSDAHIVFGPNGTGKSTLFEAISLAICGASSKVKQYYEDPDVSGQKDYLAAVFAPLSGGSPKISLNDNPWDNAQIARQTDDIDTRLMGTDGNLLGQEDSRRFLEFTGKDLGVRILAGYSTLAERSQSMAKSASERANTVRQKWLKQYDLPENITRPEKRLQRLAEHILNREIPALSVGLADWLARVRGLSPSFAGSTSDLAQRWQRNDGVTQRDSLTGQIASSDNIEGLIHAWLEERNLLIEETRRLLDSVRPEVEALRAERDILTQELDQWGEWLGRQAMQMDIRVTNDEHTTLVRQIEEAHKDNEQLVKEGVFLKQHADHLANIRREFLPNWAKERPDECPTCGADHKAHGGVLSVVEELYASLQKQLDTKRDVLKQKQVALKQIEARLAALGQCPLSTTRRDMLTHKLAGLTESTSLEVILADRAKRARLQQELQLMSVLPGIPDRIDDTASQARKLALDIASLNAEGEYIWHEPTNWKEIDIALKEECQAIVERHLPETLGAVWLEIAHTLTPANWNLAARPRFDSSLKYGAERLVVIADHENRKMLARHLFNQAEQHILGLGWFFTRYFTEGRFRHALAALDDPAQEMDQTSFRTFTRFLRVFLRLHKLNEQPLTLLLFLHQEDRALDAARATGGQFFMLKWEREPGKSGRQPAIQQVVLLNEGFKPSLPKVHVKADT